MACRRSVHALFDMPAWVAYNTRHCSQRANIMKRLFAIILLLISVLLAACAPDIPQIPPSEIITGAGQAMLNTPSFHFTIELSGAPVTLNPATRLTLRSAEGDFARPDKMGVHLKIIAAVAAAELDLIALGNNQYITDILTHQWEVLPPKFGFNPAVLFDPQVGLEQLLKSGLDNPHWIGVETMDGATVYHLQGSLDGARVQGMSGGLIHPGRVDVDLWIEPGTSLLRQAVLVDTASDPEKPATWTLTFSSYGKPVNITTPNVK